MSSISSTVMEGLSSRPGQEIAAGVGLGVGVIGAALWLRDRCKVKRNKRNAVHNAQQFGAKHPHLARRVHQEAQEVRTASRSRRWVAWNSMVSSGVGMLSSAATLGSTITQGPKFDFAKSVLGKVTYVVSAGTNILNAGFQMKECIESSCKACDTSRPMEARMIYRMAATDKGTQAGASLLTATGAILALVYQSTAIGIGTTVVATGISVVSDFYAKRKIDTITEKYGHVQDVHPAAMHTRVSGSGHNMREFLGSLDVSPRRGDGGVELVDDKHQASPSDRSQDPLIQPNSPSVQSPTVSAKGDPSFSPSSLSFGIEVSPSKPGDGDDQDSVSLVSKVSPESLRSSIASPLGVIHEEEEGTKEESVSHPHVIQEESVNEITITIKE